MAEPIARHRVWEVGAERRLYLPLVALIIFAVVGAVWMLERMRRPRAIEVAAFAAIAASLAAVTIRRNRDYRSALDLARTVLEGWPSPFAKAMLGQELAIAGRHDEAMTHLRAAAPGYPAARYHLGGELFNAGRLSEAVPELEAFVRDAPYRAEAVTARTMLGRASMLQRQLPGAEKEFRLVLTMAPPGSAAYISARRARRLPARGRIEPWRCRARRNLELALESMNKAR